MGMQNPLTFFQKLSPEAQRKHLRYWKIGIIIAILLALLRASLRSEVVRQKFIQYFQFLSQQLENSNPWLSFLAGTLFMYTIAIGVAILTTTFIIGILFPIGALILHALGYVSKTDPNNVSMKPGLFLFGGMIVFLTGLALVFLPIPFPIMGILTAWISYFLLPRFYITVKAQRMVKIGILSVPVIAFILATVFLYKFYGLYGMLW